MFKILSIGRISPVKDYETLILAAEILKDKRIEFQFDIIGVPTPKDRKYSLRLKKMVQL